MPMGWLIAAIGAFTVCGAALDWEFFMDHPKARFFVDLLGRLGARVFYGLLGLLLIALAVLMAAGFVQRPR